MSNDQKHTPEPWRVVNKDTVHGDSDRLIADCENTPYSLRPSPPSPTDMANARRIVACVNACEGISTEALEGVNLRKNAENLAKERREAIEQRDALLAALEPLLARAMAHQDFRHRNGTEVFNAHAAIASVKGSA